VPSVVVGTVESMPPGTQRSVKIGHRTVAVFNVGGEFFALRDACPHQGALLSRGRVVPCIRADRPGEYRHDPNRRFIRCPWHGWEYDLATGQSYIGADDDRVRAFDVSIEDGASVLGDRDPETGRVPGPYVAETITVSVQDECVVIHV
jgi:nitrite reductase/ring-hydroxylating ferredoxin subunit